MGLHTRFIDSKQEMIDIGKHSKNKGSICVLNNLKYELILSDNTFSIWKDSNGFMIQC